jgi:hypothetical protein
MHSRLLALEFEIDLNVIGVFAYFKYQSLILAANLEGLKEIKNL